MSIAPVRHYRGVPRSTYSLAFTGKLARYAGSLTEHHGALVRIVGTCACWECPPGRDGHRFVLALVDKTGEHLYHVRPASVRLLTFATPPEDYAEQANVAHDAGDDDHVTRCVHCGDRVIKDYNGRGSGWSHFPGDSRNGTYECATSRAAS